MKKPYLSCVAAIVLLPLIAGVARAQVLGPEWLSTPTPIGNVWDLSDRFKVLFTGSVAHWEKARPDGTIEHLAGRSTAGDLHVISWAASSNDVNVTAATGVAIQGSPAAWLGSPPREQVAAISSAGDVVLFTWTPDKNWTAANLSAGTGKKFKGSLVGWTTPTAPLREHVAALSTADELLVFSRSGDDPFVAVDVTNKTGLEFSGLGGAWNIKGDLFTIVHLVAVGQTDNKLYDLTSANLRNWTATEIPTPAGYMATPDLSAWFSSSAGTENVAVRMQTNALVVLSRSSAGGNWEASDLTAIDGEEVTGRPVPYREDSLAVSGKNGRALIFWRTARSPLWQLLDLAELRGVAWEGAPAAWGSDAVAGVHPANHHLYVVWNFIEARRLTELVSERFETLRAQSGTRQTVTIVWNPETTTANCNPTGCKPCDPAEIGKGLKLEPAKADAAMRDVAAYFRENSGGLMAVANTTLGPYGSLKHRFHYTEEHGPGKCEDGWNTPGGGEVEKLAEAIRQAEPGFDFKKQDTSGDGTLSPDELAVIVMIPGAGNRGGVRPVVAENNAPLVVDGVKILQVIEIDVGSSGVPHLFTIAREFSRYVLDHVDMRWTPPSPWPFLSPPATALGAFALMDGVQAQGHHDAFTKLKFGWVRPRILWHPGGPYTLKDVETRHSVRVLLHPTRGAGEFFLIENRFPGGSVFDRELPAAGLAIYHVLQDPAARRDARPPFHINAGDWSRIGAADWGHKAVRLIPPVPNRGYVSTGPSVPYDDTLALWRTPIGYDLEPFPTANGRAWLRYSDGSNPGLAIRNISPAGSEMSFTLATVPIPGREFCEVRRKECGSIDDGFGGQVDCGFCFNGGVCGAEIPNVCCQPISCGGSLCGVIDRGCGLGTEDCGDPCPTGAFCHPVEHRCEFLPEPCRCGGKPPCIPCPEDPVAPPPPADAEKRPPASQP